MPEQQAIGEVNHYVVPNLGKDPMVGTKWIGRQTAKNVYTEGVNTMESNLVRLSTVLAQLVAIKVDLNATRFQYSDNLFIAMDELGKPLQTEELIGHWSFMALSHELTEEHWNRVIPEGTNGAFKSSKEYGESLLRANYIYEVNPYGEQKPTMPDYSIQEWIAGGSAVYEARLASWEAAQQRTGKWIIMYQINHQQ